MITLITGTPGTGKTALLIAQLLEHLKLNPDRLVYQHGIMEFKLPHLELFCRSSQCKSCRERSIPENALYVEQWNEFAEPGALFIIDECQRIWRPRNPTQPLPPAVAALETHRHEGLDFWLISQGPHLFDKFIRLLVGRHIHVVAKWNGRKQYEWPECKQDVESKADAVQRSYKLPKHVYSLYKSAEIHTKQDKRKPIAFYVLIALLVALPIMIYAVYGRVSPKMQNQQTAAESEPIGQGGLPPAHGERGADGFPDFQAKLPGVPESAPAYARVLKVQQAPILAACVATEKRCQCYTAQATKYPASDEYCRIVAKEGHFNPYLEVVKRPRELPPTRVTPSTAPPLATRNENAPGYIVPDSPIKNHNPNYTDSEISRTGQETNF